MSTMNTKDITSDTQKVPALLLGGGDLPIIHEHINSKDNPHGVTAEQIGAASQTDYTQLKQAVIDQSLEDEARSSPEGIFDEGSSWEKYLDGTFTFFGTTGQASVWFDLETGEYSTDEPIGDVYLYFPFDVYDESYSYNYYENPYSGTGFEIPEGSIEIVMTQDEEYNQPPNFRHVTIYATEELYTKMIDEGVSDLYIFIDMSITGRWRIDV